MSRTPKNSGGRPELYSQELADRILDRMACGETLTAICRDEDMPHRATVRRWISRHEGFCEAYTRARELLADVYAEQALDIADDPTGDVMTDAKGIKRVDNENVQRSRLRCDMRRWYAAKLAPRRYGEKISQEISGPSDGPIEFSRPLLPDELATAVVKLLGAAEQEVGLPSGEGKPDQERIDAIKAVNGALPPILYDALHQVMRSPNDPLH
jgi:hypothetical protein